MKTLTLRAKTLGDADDKLNLKDRRRGGISCERGGSNRGGGSKVLLDRPTSRRRRPKDFYTAVMFVLFGAGAMMIHGIQPGPRVITSNPALFWGVIVSMWIGNVFLVLLNLPLIGLWVRLLSVPFRLLYPAILLFCCIGLYSVNNNTFDIALTALCGLLGYIFSKLECEPAPLILGFILGPMMEENLRRGMLLSRGDALVFFTRPLSQIFLLLAAAMLVAVALPAIRRGREQAFQEK